MFVLLFFGVLCYIFLLGVGKYFGLFINGMIIGMVFILVVWFFCMGVLIKLSVMGMVLCKFGMLVVIKIVVVWVVAVIVLCIILEYGVEVGFFVGFLMLVLVAVMDMINGGFYVFIMQQYGIKEEVGVFVLMLLEFGLFMMMIILGIVGIVLFELYVFVGVVLLFLVGFVLGNFDFEL